MSMTMRKGKIISRAKIALALFKRAAIAQFIFQIPFKMRFSPDGIRIA
jgi:hypothetical protein